MKDNTLDPTYLEEIDQPLSGNGTGEYGNVRLALDVVNKNVTRLRTNQREVERVLKKIRDDFEEFRDRSFAALDATMEGTKIEQGSWIMLRLGQLSSKLNGHMETLQLHGVMPKAVEKCEECDGWGMTGDHDRLEPRHEVHLPVTCMRCGGSGEK